MKRRYLSPTEVENELQKAREKIGFVAQGENAAVKAMVQTAKQNGKFGDKVLMVLPPEYIHIPEWQRKLNVERAREIGTNYNRYKWEVPKIVHENNRLLAIDGMHRIYGAFLARKESICVEVMEISEKQAIELFLGQSNDRGHMSPTDYYKASIKAELPEYIRFRDICHKNNIQIKGDDALDNPIGVFSSISDGIKLARNNPQLLDRILKLLNKLQWNAKAADSTTDGRAYSAKYIRIMKKLYAYNAGKEKAMEAALLKNCKGSEWFCSVIANKAQDTAFDVISSYIKMDIEKTISFKNAKNMKKVVDECKNS